MDRVKFEKKLKDRYNYEYLDDASIDDVLELVEENTEPINTTASSGRDRQLLIVMEELAELTQEVSKFLRGKGDPIGLLEEMADVSIALRHTKRILCVDEEDLRKAICVKLDEALDKMGSDKNKRPIR